MRIILLLVLWIVFSIHLFAAEKFTTQQAVFAVDDSAKMTGMLYLPKDAPLKKVIIEFSDRLVFRNACDSLSYDFSIMQKLVDGGVGWFIVSPTSVFFNVSNSYKMAELMNLRNIQGDAAYLDAAVSYLKRTIDTKACSIGVLGQSEAGMVAAISTSRNPDIDFLISVTSFMIKGTDFMSFNILSPENVKTHRNNWTLFDNFKKYVKGKFVYNHVTYQKSDSTFNLCISSMLDTIGGIVAKIDLNTPNVYAKIHNLTKEKIIQLWGFSDADFENNGLKSCLTHLCSALYNPHDVSFIKWDPQAYFSKINVPTLILLGEKDGLMPFEKNLAGIHDIIKVNNKKNITVKVLKGSGHAMSVVKSEAEKSNAKNSVSSSRNCPDVPESTINYIADWIQSADTSDKNPQKTMP